MWHPAFLGDVRMSVVPLPDDTDGATEQTLRVMQRFAELDAASAPVGRAVESALGPGLDWDGRVSAIFRWIKSHVRFVQDSINCLPTGYGDCETAEVLIRPVDLLRMAYPSGDCDDFAMLGYSMLKRAGIHCRFATLAADRKYPDVWTHVYLVAVRPDGREIAFDTSHGPHVGWWADWASKRKVWRSSMLAGLGDTASLPWWQQAINSSISIAGDVIRAKAGIQPVGTVIQSGTGTYVRSGTADYTGGSVGPVAGGVASVGSGTLLLIGAGVLAVALLAGGRRS